MKLNFIPFMMVATALTFCSPQESDHSHDGDTHSHDADTHSHDVDAHSHDGDGDEHFHQEEFSVDSTSEGKVTHHGVATHP